MFVSGNSSHSNNSGSYAQVYISYHAARPHSYSSFQMIWCKGLELIVIAPFPQFVVTDATYVFPLHPRLTFAQVYKPRGFGLVG